MHQINVSTVKSSKFFDVVNFLNNRRRFSFIELISYFFSFFWSLWGEHKVEGQLIDFPESIVYNKLCKMSKVHPTIVFSLMLTVVRVDMTKRLLFPALFFTFFFSTHQVKYELLSSEKYKATHYAQTPSHPLLSILRPLFRINCHSWTEDKKRTLPKITTQNKRRFCVSPETPVDIDDTLPTRHAPFRSHLTAHILRYYYRACTLHFIKWQNTLNAHEKYTHSDRVKATTTQTCQWIYRLQLTFNI